MNELIEYPFFRSPPQVPLILLYENLSLNDQPLLSSYPTPLIFLSVTAVEEVSTQNELHFHRLLLLLTNWDRLLTGYQKLEPNKSYQAVRVLVGLQVRPQVVLQVGLGQRSGVQVEVQADQNARLKDLHPHLLSSRDEQPYLWL